jgi:long-chain acyl-CoA synthetase
VTDTDEHLERLARVRARLGRDFVVFHTGTRAGEAVQGIESTSLRQAAAQVDLEASRDLFGSRRIDLTAPATVMFTSGSTGNPRGVVFSHYNLVAKRFARAAALPSVGRGEILLSFLPLFHTFGRFLEMSGMIYWGGTYVFTGNPSAEALIAEMGRVRPTGLISIPLRWAQIRELCLEAMDRASSTTSEESTLRSIVGDRLRWGLSAAGFLDPKVFRFFQRHGVDLCSGFGMTEATGGITMTPPGAYVDGTVGVPLPGMRLDLSPQGELLIGGPYVARYMEEAASADTLPEIDPEEEFRLPTGDLFVRRDDGYYEIVDRIKDLYKNSRGQTIAPQRVEQRVASVPGVRRVFLAGDHRDYNVLLIVPDRHDPVLASLSDRDVYEYLGQIVASANASLAPYERAVRFAVLDRDFDVEREELTPKGSFRRKVIERNFGPAIESLYVSKHVELAVGDLAVRLPRWFFRDLAILEDDVVADDASIRDRRSGARLRIARDGDGLVRVGDLEYALPGNVVDLGLFARQPRLWIGNPSLVAFSPCKPGWDVSPGAVSDRARRPRVPEGASLPAESELRSRVTDDSLREIHVLCARAIFGDVPDALAAIELLGARLARSDVRTGSVIRHRLAALAYRPEEELRTTAYRVLLLDEPMLDYGSVVSVFIESDLTFLNEESIATIARARLGESRLQALRQRLYTYRTNLSWPAPDARRTQFRGIFRLLSDFARLHRDFFAVVQAELACWALFREDASLARAATIHLDDLTQWYEVTLADSVAQESPSRPTDRLVFDAGVPPEECRAIETVLFDPTFLLESITLAFGEPGFDWSRVPRTGVWVSPILSHDRFHLYRLGINLADGRHFDLLLVTGDDLREDRFSETILWLKALSSQTFETPVLPRFGAWRRDLGALSVSYVSDLTAWERIRDLSTRRDVHGGRDVGREWQKLFIRAIATFFRAWKQSGHRIVPGAVTPANVAIPDADFHEGTRILSFAGLRPYEGPLSLTLPLMHNFYSLTKAHYPRSGSALRADWIFDACIDALGHDEAAAFFDELESEMGSAPPSGETGELRAALAAHREKLRVRPHIPLPVICAIDRFRDWETSNPLASPTAREDAVIQMVHLYRIDRFPDAFRNYVYQHTYFASHPREVHDAFDRLVARRLGDAGAAPGYIEELWNLQSLLSDPDDREVFSRMAFPHAQKTQRLEFLAVGDTEKRRVIVRSEIANDRGLPFVVREPTSPVEVGQLYRLILETDYPKQIARQDLQLVVTDSEERIVGGLCYRWQEEGIVYAHGIVIAGPLTNQRLGGRLIEDFCVRMASQGARLVKTNYFLGRLLLKHGFHVNERWGGFVRFLAGTEDGADEA